MKIKFELLTNLSKDKLSQRQKIFLSASIGWIVFIGFLTWLNGINDMALIKTFRWDEWFWFGIVPATTPYIIYYIWRPQSNQEDDKQE
ncbi:hypothetical protein IDH27_04130 [Pelagibacterales bacterium SAG-MED46]|nr:hypothetical protein [Pelagibacterales bacterium SAG-MED46]